MTETIILLRPRGERQSPLAGVDVTAMELLTTGQAPNLQAARAEVILADLRVQRDHLTTLLADLRRRKSTADAQADETGANLVTAINSGIIQIDLFIARAQVFVAEASQSRSARSSTLGSAS